MKRRSQRQVPSVGAIEGEQMPINTVTSLAHAHPITEERYQMALFLYAIGIHGSQTRGQRYGTFCQHSTLDYIFMGIPSRSRLNRIIEFNMHPQ